MKYFRLADEVIMVNDDNEAFFYCFGEEKWKKQDVICNGDEITETEAHNVLDEQRQSLNDMLKLAEKTAAEKHSGQLDKGGNPYFNHPQAVAAQLENTEYKIAAYLHDVCEDTPTTFEDLLEMGFAPRIVESIRLLTKAEDISYEEYLEKIKSDDCARNVKMADIRHNMDISRIPCPSEKDFARLEKYRKALKYLEE
ncbi:HD domain-containing protein [Ruminococcus flavefaciens]|uniref:HD domain-containing protein n=1 Tax=Ruminococcus flavefaciens TaxID=1265 RepID=A0A1M7J291_RUMFL|nr:HD domain-containing protein [Ruminococcus flavefaciens]SHM47190.1 HD domain-containing protein [Ruminococcus flavefaciens]